MLGQGRQTQGDGFKRVAGPVELFAKGLHVAGLELGGSLSEGAPGLVAQLGARPAQLRADIAGQVRIVLQDFFDRGGHRRIFFPEFSDDFGEDLLSRIDGCGGIRSRFQAVLFGSNPVAQGGHPAGQLKRRRPAAGHALDGKELGPVECLGGREPLIGQVHRFGLIDQDGDFAIDLPVDQEGPDRLEQDRDENREGGQPESEQPAAARFGGDQGFFRAGRARR